MRAVQTYMLARSRASNFFLARLFFEEAIEIGTEPIKNNRFIIEVVRFLVYRFRVHESLAKIVKTLTLVYPSTRNWIHDCDFRPIMKSVYESLVRVWAAKLELQN